MCVCARIYPHVLTYIESILSKSFFLSYSTLFKSVPKLLTSGLCFHILFFIPYLQFFFRVAWSAPIFIFLGCLKYSQVVLWTLFNFHHPYHHLLCHQRILWLVTTPKGWPPPDYKPSEPCCQQRPKTLTCTISSHAENPNTIVFLCVQVPPVALL